MVPATTTRVEQNTDDAINDRIRRQTQRNIAYFAGLGSREINRRLEELDREWDVERTLEANAASLSLLSLGLGAIVNRRFFLVPAFVGGFLLQHAIQGWCPPLPVLRRLGIRTAKEIDAERYALKALRGDFKNLPEQEQGLRQGDVEHILEAATR
ncbi:MAG: hypothetical protein K0S58_3070 [Nitrospira sp.]|nr:hypothetical protein [Nitrospira sp.]